MAFLLFANTVGNSVTQLWLNKTRAFFQLKNRLVNLGACLTLLCSNTAHADVFGLIRTLTMDRLQFEVQVTDQSGKPLAGAVIWYIGQPTRPQTGMKVDQVAAKRMAVRYVRQSDFLDTGDIPGAVFERTNNEGQYRDFRETRYPDGRYPYIVVATKRGYLPEVSEGVAPLNKHHLVKFQLKPDLQSQADPRMEAFDQLMAQARSPVPGEDLVGESRMQKISALNQQVRALAQTLEKDGRNDEASAVYWALADFPDVIRVDLPNGTQQIVGYRNGRNDPQAEADRLHATMLNSTVPKLTIPKEMVKQGFQRTGIYTEAHGKAYLEAFERIANSPQGEQLLPIEYAIAVRQTIRWSTPDYACAMLQRAYRFEPTAITPKDGSEMLRRIAAKRAELKLAPQDCIVEGLVKFERGNGL